MTEAEARKKACPFSVGVYEREAFSCKCEGSECLAWTFLTNPARSKKIFHKSHMRERVDLISFDRKPPERPAGIPSSWIWSPDQGTITTDVWVEPDEERLARREGDCRRLLKEKS